MKELVHRGLAASGISESGFHQKERVQRSDRLNYTQAEPFKETTKGCVSAHTDVSLLPRTRGALSNFLFSAGARLL